MKTEYVIYNGELYHYGVRGMKWGHRKAAKYTAKAAALRKKGDTANANKYMQKAAIKKREAAFQGKQAKAGESRSRGAKIATNLLAGPFANRTYNSVIAAGGSKWQARGVTAAASLLGPLGHVATAYAITKHKGEKITKRVRDY